MDVTLYHMPGACSRVTLTALEWTGAPYRVVAVPFHKDGLNDPEFRRLNPAGQVPTLLIDGEVLTETAVILVTLARLYPDRGLLPIGQGVVADGQAASRLLFCSSQLHPIVTRLVIPQRFCDQPAEAVARVRHLATLAMLEKLALIEPALAQQPWWLGEWFSIADVYLVWVTHRLRALGLDLGGLPAIVAHREAVLAQPVVRQALALEARFVAELEADGSRLPPQFRSLLALQ